MKSRLDAITDWKRLARKSGYRVDKLSEVVGVTGRELERYFAKAFRLSPKAWVDNLRMSDARRCLQRGMSIKEVAGRLGFKHAQDFSRAYVRINGAPPSELRHTNSPYFSLLSVAWGCITQTPLFLVLQWDGG